MGLLDRGDAADMALGFVALAVVDFGEPDPADDPLGAVWAIAVVANSMTPITNFIITFC